MTIRRPARARVYQNSGARAGDVTLHNITTFDLLPKAAALRPRSLYELATS
jgi:hypothetical protein